MEFADDIVLLAHNYQQMQDEITLIEESATKLGLSVSKGKTKTMRMNNTNINPIMLQKRAIEDVSSFTYLGNIVSTARGTNEDFKARTGKARVAFNNLQKYGNLGT